jgi:hypothetical protein
LTSIWRQVAKLCKEGYRHILVLVSAIVLVKLEVPLMAMKNLSFSGMMPEFDGLDLTFKGKGGLRQKSRLSSAASDEIARALR